MSTAATCPLCAGPLPDDRQPCPQCHASPEWIEQGQAIDFALRNFEEWRKKGLISERCLNDLADYYARQREKCARLASEDRPIPENAGLLPFGRCWSCSVSSDTPPEYCADCGIPGTRRRRAVALSDLFASRNQEPRRDRPIAAGPNPRLRQRNSRAHRRPAAQAGEAAPAHRRSRRGAATVRERSGPLPNGRGSSPQLHGNSSRPRTIQCLLGLGGAMLVIGLVIYLAVLGIFENAVSVAVLLGITNAAVLVGGWTIILRHPLSTRRPCPHAPGLSRDAAQPLVLRLQRSDYVRA